MDAINGVGKNTTHREAMKTSSDRNLDRAGKSDTLQLQTFTVNNVRDEKQCSVALNCKHFLGKKGAEGVKSESKSAKRERERGINKRHLHVRDLTEELSNVKCATIKDSPDNSCELSDIQHCCTCSELGPGKAALRRFPRHLVEFTGLPRTEQGEVTNGCAWRVDSCHWLHSVPNTRHWHTKSLRKQTVDWVRVLATDVGMKPTLPASMMKNRAVRQEAEQKKQ